MAQQSMALVMGLILKEFIDKVLECNVNSFG